MCCSRPDAGPPSMKTAAASTEAGSGQPSAPAQGADGKAADEQVGVDDQVERAHRRRRVEPGPHHEGRARRSATADRRRSGGRRSDRGSRTACCRRGWSRRESGRRRRTGSWRPRARRCRSRSSGWRRRATRAAIAAEREAQTAQWTGPQRRLGVRSKDRPRIEHARPFAKAEGGGVITPSAFSLPRRDASPCAAPPQSLDAARTRCSKVFCRFGLKCWRNRGPIRRCSNEVANERLPIGCVPHLDFWTLLALSAFRIG